VQSPLRLLLPVAAAMSAWRRGSNIPRLKAVQMMVHWPSYLYIYPSWTDILAYYTDRITDVTGEAAALLLRCHLPCMECQTSEPLFCNMPLPLSIGLVAEPEEAHGEWQRAAWRSQKSGEPLSRGGQCSKLPRPANMVQASVQLLKPMHSQQRK
jgi:hypothetical protein